MVFRKPRVERLAVRASNPSPFPSRHLLFSVTGSSGRLRLEWGRLKEGESAGEDSFYALMLGDVPLVQAQTSGCPTCESLLAAGHGVPDGCPGLREAASRLTAPYTGLEDALERLSPVIGLLLPGVYILSRTDCCPTDGSGNFFWDAPNGFAPSPATAEIYDSGTYQVLPSFPFFLYPSQPTDKYDPRRVEEYRALLRAGQALPPALAYFVGGYLCILLDGHHRACACALEGASLPCLVLSRPGRIWRNGRPFIYWPDAGETATDEVLTPRQEKLLTKSANGVLTQRGTPLAPGELFTREWEPAYREAAARYPTCMEAGALALYGLGELTLENLEDLGCPGDSPILASLLRCAARRPGVDPKALALGFAAKGNPIALRREAFQILCGIKGDPEIEDFFVDFLVECEDKSNPLRRIADRYWD